MCCPSRGGAFASDILNLLYLTAGPVKGRERKGLLTTDPGKLITLVMQYFQWTPRFSVLLVPLHMHHGLVVCFVLHFCFCFLFFCGDAGGGEGEFLIFLL